MAEYSCLIVEDSPMMRQLLVFALARVKNLRVTEADDGVDGLRKLASTKYDIIITDINMPIMDGLKLVKRVRSDPVHRDTPIIIITIPTGMRMASITNRAMTPIIPTVVGVMGPSGRRGPCPGSRG